MVCCDLGGILEDEGRIVLFRSHNFFVTPALGPIEIEGYLMIVSNKHHEGLGDMPKTHYRELQDMIDLARGVIKGEYGKSSLVFEHGPKVRNISGGGCLDHAHLHVVPGVDILREFSIDQMRRLAFAGQYYRVERIEGFDKLAEIHHKGRSSYTLVEAPDLTRLVVEVNSRLPSQYLRQMVGQNTGSREWSWKQYPNKDLMNKTADRLDGKF